MSNLLKTGLLMAAIMALFGAVGAAAGGAQGMLLALALGAGMNFLAYWYSDAMVLRMYGAREANFGMFFGGRDDDNRNPVFAILILILILAPIAAMLIQFAISRSREYDADRGGAAICGDPQALASALSKIERHARGLPLATAEANPSTAQMINPDEKRAALTLRQTPSARSRFSSV